MDKWFKDMADKLANKSKSDEKGCRMWLGGPCTEKHKYGTLRIKLPGGDDISRVTYVHRVAYMVSRQVACLPQGLEVSHLCHHPRCIEGSHLCLETHETNAERRSCYLQGICTQNHEPQCIV